MSVETVFRFRLFVAGDTLNSAQAVQNLTKLCVKYLAKRHEIEIIDVLQEPKRALKDGVLMTPTLVRLQPGPPKKIVGTLSKTDTVLQALGLEP